MVGVPVPVSALYTPQRLQLYTLNGVYRHMCASYGIVYAEAALFVGTEYQSAAELVVEVTYGKVYTLACFPFQEYMGHAPSLEVGFKSRQRMIVVFQSCSCLDVLACKAEVSIGVGQYVVLV